MDTATAFDALEVPPLAGATRDFVVPVLLSVVSDVDKTANRSLRPSASIVPDYPICA